MVHVVARLVAAVAATLFGVTAVGSVAAVASPADSECVAIYTYNAPIYDQLITYADLERGPPAVTPESTAAVGQRAGDPGPVRSLARSFDVHRTSNYAYDALAQAAQAAQDVRVGGSGVQGTGAELEGLAGALSSLETIGVAAKNASTAIQKGVGTQTTKVWVRKYPSGGGGVGINRNGTNVFRAGKSNWKQDGEWVTGLKKYSVHYGKTSSQRGRHRPWE